MTCQEVWATADTGTVTASIFAVVPQPGAPPIITEITTLPTIKATGVIPFAAMSRVGDIYEPVLNGEGAGLVDNGGTGTGLISYKLGAGAGKYTQGGVDVRGANQFLGVVVPAGTGDGKYVMYAEIVPAGGENYSK